MVLVWSLRFCDRGRNNISTVTTTVAYEMGLRDSIPTNGRRRIQAVGNGLHRTLRGWRSCSTSRFADIATGKFVKLRKQNCLHLSRVPVQHCALLILPQEASANSVCEHTFALRSCSFVVHFPFNARSNIRLKSIVIGYERAFLCFWRYFLCICK